MSDETKRFRVVNTEQKAMVACVAPEHEEQSDTMPRWLRDQIERSHKENKDAWSSTLAELASTNIITQEMMKLSQALLLYSVPPPDEAGTTSLSWKQSGVGVNATVWPFSKVGRLKFTVTSRGLTTSVTDDFCEAAGVILWLIMPAQGITKAAETATAKHNQSHQGPAK